MKEEIEKLILRLENQSENCKDILQALSFSDTGRVAYRLTGEVLDDIIKDLKVIIKWYKTIIIQNEINKRREIKNGFIRIKQISIRGSQRR